MTHRSHWILLWTPRILGIVVSVFLSLFALDALGKTDFAMHLVPMLALLAVVGLSWRRAWLGGVVFTGLAIVYAYFARHHVPWIAVVAGPLLVVGILFSWSWKSHGALTT